MPRLKPNLFGLPFGLAGLAACWTAAGGLVDAPRFVATIVWVLAGVAWLVILVPYAGQVLRERRLVVELADPTFGPFTAVPAMLIMLLGGALAEASRTAGVVVFLVGLVATVLVGGYLTGDWIVRDLKLVQWHPGYFLPTVGGGLIAATVAARLGFASLASLMFGYGLVCWFVLGSIILARLVTQPMLPLKLRPTLAIELAPSAVAGNAWFAMHGGRADTVGAMIAGYGLVMLLVQLRLIPVFREVPFGPGTWAFAFSYLQAVTVTLHWLAAEQVPGRAILTWVALAVATAGVVWLLVRTGTGLVRRTFLPREPEPAAVVPSARPSVPAGA